MGKIWHGKIMQFWCWSLLNREFHPSRFTNLFPRSAVGIISTSYSVGCRVHVWPALACAIPGHIPWRKREKHDLKRNPQLAVKPTSAFCGTNCQSTVLRVRLILFPCYYFFILHKTHKLCFKVQTSVKKHILIQRCTQNFSSSGTMLPVVPRPLVAGTAPVLFECFIVMLPLFLENFYLSRAVKYLCLSLCLWEARTGIDKVLISHGADKAEGLGTKSSPPHPDLACKWALTKCDSWEKYCTLVWEQNTSKFGSKGRKTTHRQPVLPVLTCILQGRKISWTLQLTECLQPLTS